MSIQDRNLNFDDIASFTLNAENTVTNITECLTEDHEKCTGKYIDSFTGNFAIICSCKCHFEKRKRAKEK